MKCIILSLVWCVRHFHPYNFPIIWPIAPRYLFNIIPFTILVTWLYNNTGKSLLMVTLFHTAGNVSDWIMPVSPIGGSGEEILPFIIKGVLTWSVVLPVIARYGSRTLTRTPSPNRVKP